MRAKLLNVFVVMYMVLSMFAMAVPASAAGPIKPKTPLINIDGDVADWAGISAATFANEVGDSGTGNPDISAYYVTSDATNVYVRIDGTQIGPAMTLHIDIDSDNNQLTGYDAANDSANLFAQTHVMGIDYDVAINIPLSTPGNTPSFTFYAMPASGGGTLLPATGMAVAVGGGGAPNMPLYYEVAIPFSLINHVLPWRIIVSTGFASPGVPYDEAPNNAYFIYQVSPSVTTGTATNITSTTATLNGTVTSFGSATSVTGVFGWGEGQTWSNDQPIGALSPPAPVSFSHNLTGLKPGTQYQFRAYVSSASGSPMGDWVNFNTPAVGALISDSFNRADADKSALGQADLAFGGAGTNTYLSLWGGLSTPIGASIVNNALQNNGQNYGGVELVTTSALPADLNIKLNALVPTNAAGNITQAGPFFRGRSANPGDGLLGGANAGYWVQLHSNGEVKVKNLNTASYVAVTGIPAAFDPTVMHSMEIAAQGTVLQVALDGKLQTFNQSNNLVTSVSILATGGSGDGRAGISFGAEPNGSLIGGERADNLIVTSFASLNGLPVQNNFSKPTAPSNLLGSPVSATQVHLTWTDNSNNENGFNVDRASDNGFLNNVVSMQAAANAVSFDDMSTSGSATYFYRVYAVNNNGPVFSDYSNVVTVVTPAGATSTATALTSSPNPSIPGQSVTFTVTVSPAPNGGTVQLKDNNIDIGGPFGLAAGQAVVTMAIGVVGVHNITAVYSGNANFATSTGSLTQTVNPPWASTIDFDAGIDASGLGPWMFDTYPDANAWVYGNDPAQHRYAYLNVEWNTAPLGTGTQGSGGSGNASYGNATAENSAILNGVNGVTVQFDHYALAGVVRTNFGVMGQAGDHRDYSGGTANVKLSGVTKLAIIDSRISMDVSWPSPWGANLGSAGSGWGTIDVANSDPNWVAEFDNGNGQVQFDFSTFSPVLQNYYGFYTTHVVLRSASRTEKTSVAFVNANGPVSFGTGKVTLNVNSFTKGGPDSPPILNSVFQHHVFSDPVGALPVGITQFVPGNYWELSSNLASLNTNITIDLTGKGLTSGTRLLYRTDPTKLWTLYPNQTTAGDGSSVTATGLTTLGQFALGVVPAPAPTVSNISPASGPAAGGTAITITGTNFASGATVTIGGVAATVGTVSVTSIAATTPAGTAGAKDVVVTNPDGQQGTKVGGFTYTPQAIATATGAGNASFSVSSGALTSLTAVAESTLPTGGSKPNASFPFGLFSYNITGLTNGQTVTVTITMPSAVPAGTQYWKYQTGWVQIPLSNFSFSGNTITLTLTDGGIGDADGQANGTIMDPGGPAVSTPPPFSVESIPSGMNNILVQNSVTGYAVGPDGQTIYAADGTPTIFKSANGGLTFTRTSLTSANFIAPAPASVPNVNLIAVAPDDANIIAFSSQTDASAFVTPTVYVSTNGGATFLPLTIAGATPIPPTGWTATGKIADITISAASGGVHYIAIAGQKASPAVAGAGGTLGISYFNLDAVISGWTDATMAPWTPPANIAGLADAQAIRFSPNFASDRTFVAVTEDQTNHKVYLQTANIQIRFWDTAAGFSTPVPITLGAVPLAAASISLAPTYFGADATARVTFVGLATDATAPAGGSFDWTGADIYRFNDATPKALALGKRVKSVAYNGSLLVIGDYDDGTVWYSTDMLAGAPTLTSSPMFQRPSGTNPVNMTRVAFAGANVVATTNGPESAFSISKDNGATFNDVSLIRTTISNIDDFSPQGYLITDNGPNVSVWHYTGIWNRVLALPKPAGTTGFAVKTVSGDPNTLYLAVLGTQIVYYSTDAGETLWTLRVSGNAVPGSGIIKGFVVESASTLYYVTPTGMVSQSTNDGFIWSDEIQAGTLTGANAFYGLGAGNLLVAGTDGNFAYSTDSGIHWVTSTVPVPGGTPVKLLAYGLTAGSYIFAITTNANDFVYRWKLGTSIVWDKITPALSDLPTPAAATSYKAISSDSNGTLYVSTSAPYVAGSQVDSTLWRTLDPTLTPSSVTWVAIPAGGVAANPVILNGKLAVFSVSGITKVMIPTASVASGGAVTNPIAPKLIGVLDKWSWLALPTMSSLSPNTGNQGATLARVQINGANLTGATAVTFSGSGVTANVIGVNLAGTQITATVTITGAATVGSRDVTVTTPPGTSAALPSAFTVTAAAPPTKDWTFMVYMAADNALGDLGNSNPNAIADLNEMETVGSTDRVNVIALVDLLGPSNTTLYQVQKENTPTPGIISTVVPLPAGIPTTAANEVNMGDPAVLAAFTTWAMTAYPANHYALILWNHGDGWREPSPAISNGQMTPHAIATDENSQNDALSTPELGSALTSIKNSTGKQVDILGFDASLMQMVEVATQIDGTSAHFMVGSEDDGSVDGYPYNTILADLTATPAQDGQTLANSIVSRYMASYPSNLATMSVVDIGAVRTTINPALDGFANAVTQNDTWDQINTARNLAEYYGDASYVDLYGFVEAMQNISTVQATKVAAATLKDAITAAVKGNAHGIGHPNSKGLSVFFPSLATDGGVDPAYHSLTFAQTTQWDEFITSFWNQSWHQIIADSSTDHTGAGPDIVGVDKGSPSANEVAFQIRFNSTVDLNNAYGMTFVDTKATGDPKTGADYAVYVSASIPANPPATIMTSLGMPKAILLVWDQTANAGAGDFVPIHDNLGAMVTLPLFASPSSYWFSVPLSLVGSPAGEIIVMQAAGTFGADGKTVTSDFAPDPQQHGWYPIIGDPTGAGDNPPVATGMPDISSVQAFRDPDKVGFMVSGTFDANIVSEIYLDTDQNVATSGLGAHGMGDDYLVRVTPGSVAGTLHGTLKLWSAALLNYQVVSTFPVNLTVLPAGGAEFDFAMNLSLLGNDEGNMGVLVFLGSSTAPLAVPDVAPNTGYATISEPQWHPLITDAGGDGNPDLLSVDISENNGGGGGAQPVSPALKVTPKTGMNGGVSFRVTVSSIVTGMYGRTYLDTDRNPLTGHVGPTSNDMGAEYRLDVFNGGAGALVGVIMHWNSNPGLWENAGGFPVFRGHDTTDYYWFTIPYAVIGETDGAMDIVQLMGTGVGPTNFTQTDGVTGHATTNGPVPTIIVGSPNGGENWTVGQTYNISWSSSNFIGTVNVSLSRDGGQSWGTPLFTGLSANGSQNWQVSGDPTTQAKIKVSSTDGAVLDASDAFFTITAAQATPPSVTSFTPVQNATNVSLSAPIVVIFSAPMNTASVASAFSLTPPAGGVSGVFSWTGNTMTFTPSALTAGTTYTATIDTGAQDNSGNHLPSAFTWSFTTGGGATPIFFVTDRDANLEVYRMNADGSSPANVTNHGAADNMPALSPDGTQIAFVSDRNGNRDIYLKSAGGSGSGSGPQLTSNSGSNLWPDWSPDGNKLVFTSDRNGNGDIYMLDVANPSVQTNLTPSTPNSGENYPAWSPDGTRIAFMSNRTNDNEIWVLTLADGSLQNVTATPGSDTFPAWSPHSDKMAFQHKEGTGKYQIYWVKADGTGGLHDLSNNDLGYNASQTYNDTQPLWPEDGSKIWFSSDRDATPQVYVLDFVTQTRVPAIYDGNNNWLRGKWASPTVTTAGLGNLTATSVTLNAVLNTRGTAPFVDVSFDWGDVNYGHNIVASQSPVNAGNTSFSANLTGLTPATSYHFRARGNGDAGAATGTDDTFTTLGHKLTIATTTGGNVTAPGVGVFSYAPDTLVNLVAVASSGNHFVNWTFTGTAPAGFNANSLTPQITMNADYSVTANFAADVSGYNLTVAHTAGGTVTQPATEASGPYAPGTQVNLVAAATSGYHFVNWTGTDVTTIGSVTSATTTITMNAAYSITANFAADAGSFSVVRQLPASVIKGQTFDVTVTFAAPANGFLAIALGDFAPTGWAVATDTTWVTPSPMDTLVTANKAEYIWSGPYAQDTAFTATYKVTVPAGATAGVYNFTSGAVEYYLGALGPFTTNVTGSSQVEVVEGARISGTTNEAKGLVLGSVTLTLDGTTSVVSGSDGAYQVRASTLGIHTIVASKTGYRNQTQTINVTDLTAVYTVNFKGVFGLVPNAPNTSYVLACIVKWKVAQSDGTGLTTSKILSVIAAWKVPIQ